MQSDISRENNTPQPLSAVAKMALFALRFYKAYLSLLFAGSCRFEPTCSQYSHQAIERFGVARGFWMTLKRLARCQPFSGKFGYDPVPEREDFGNPSRQSEYDHSCRTKVAQHEALS
jgi:uncharacterized protein